jgi:hypothetical protein
MENYNLDPDTIVFCQQAISELGLTESDYCLWGYPNSESEFFDCVKIVVGKDKIGTCIYEKFVERYPFTYQEFIEKVEKYKNIHKNNQYQRDRAKLYPSIEDQLDLLYHKGYDAWKEEINKIKQEYPKPE